MKLALLVVLLPALASADLRPRKDASKRGDVSFWIERRGTGEAPYASDEITYRVDFYWNHVEPAEHREETIRPSQLDRSGWSGDLHEMRVGERRYVWGRMQNGNHCDHFGCSKGPEPYTVVLELVSVTPHHDALPGGMRIVAHPLRVVDGDVEAPLPSDPIDYIEHIAVAGEAVTLLVKTRPYGTHVARYRIAELRARIAHARAVRAIRALELDTARKHLDEALAIDANLDEARAHRAALGNADDLAVLAKRNPVWLAWFARSDPFAKPLTKQLPAPLRGSIGAADKFAVYVEPTNRWIGVPVVPGYNGEVMRIYDRTTGALAASIPLDKRGVRALVALGFAAGPTPLLRDEPDLQTARIDALAIARWRHEAVSDVSVTRLPTSP